MSRQLSIQSISPKGSTSEVLKRIKALQEELASFEQGDADTSSFAGVKKDLISHSFLLHKDRTVKAYLACCLADLLKIYAPDAPYSELELRDIFQFIFRQLKNLGKKSADHTNEQYYYLLDSLSNAKSACLVCDLPNAEEQIPDAFKDFFDAISADTPKTVSNAMADILSQLIDESQTLPQEVVDILLAQFLPKSAKLKPTSYQLAADVCKGSSDRLQRYISQYFTDVFSNAEKEINEENVDVEEMTEFLTAHDLIKELDRTVPAVLLNVIPQLEQELKVENIQLRSLAIRTLGSMFAEHSGTLDHLARRYPATWKSWLGRSIDKNAAVRVLVLEALTDIWSAHGELAKDIQEVVRAKLRDPDDKVRAAACAVLASAELETLIHHVDVSLLKDLAERIKDKKRTVATEALKNICRLYDMAYPEIETGETAVIDHFAWIPNHVLTSYNTSDRYIQSQIEANTAQYLLPLPSRLEEESAWVDRFLNVLGSLSEKGKAILWRISRISDRRPSIWSKYLEACIKFNGGTIDENEEIVTSTLNKVVAFLARFFPEPIKAAEDLRKFAKMNENRLYRLLQTLMDPQIDLKTMIKTYPECLRRIEQSSSALIGNFSIFTRNCTLLYVNRASIPSLVKYLQEADDTKTALAIECLSTVAKGCPSLFQHYTADLVALLDTNLDDVSLEVVLLALSELSKVDSENIVFDKALIDRCNELIKEGVRNQPKYAATLLATNPESSNYIDDLVDDLVQSLPGSDGAPLLARLSALNRFAKRKPTTLQSYDETLSRFTNSLVTRGSSDEAIDEEAPDWLEDDEENDQVKAVLAGLKLMTNRCLHQSEDASGKDFVKAFFTLLWSILRQDLAEYHKPSANSRLRLQAASSILKLATKASLEPYALSKLELLVWTVQDPTYAVRNRFIRKLGKYLNLRRLGDARFSLALYLVAHDPEIDNVQLAKGYIIGRLANVTPELRLREFEVPFLRLLHLLAHHPDTTRETDDVLISAKYIRLYLDCVARKENIELLHHLCLKLRTVRDATSQGHSENLYTLAELSQHIISVYASSHNWPLSSYPGHVKMPSDIFKPLPSKDVQSDVAKKTWLSPETLEAINTSLKHKSEGAEKKPKKAAAPRKRKSSPKANGTKKKARTSITSKKSKKKDWEGSDEDLVFASDDDGEEDQQDEAEDDDEAVPKAKKSNARAKAKPSKSSKMDIDGQEKPTRKSSRTRKPIAQVEQSESELSELGE